MSVDDATGAPPETSAGQRGIAMYKVAYEEGIRTIDDQVSELDSMRQRSLQFLSFVGAATAFLVGAGLSQADRAGAFRWLAGTSSVISILAILMTVLVLFGFHFVSQRHGADARKKPAKFSERLSRWHRWQFRLTSAVLVEDWIDRDLGDDAEREFLRDLALFYDAEATENERKLSRIRIFYYLAVVFGAAQVVLWAAVVWLYR